MVSIDSKFNKRYYMLDQVINEILIYAHELSREDSPGVNVGSVGLESLIIAQDLTGTCCRHWGN